jgi:hypothetical protein
MSRESRWFWIPAIFGLSMFVALILWWLPAALARPNGGLGVGQVIAGDMVLAWKAFLRCVVAYVVTIVALKWLPPIYWWQAFIVAAAALVVEIFAEVVTARFIGASADSIWQLVATAIGYSVILVASIAFVRKGSHR